MWKIRFFVIGALTASLWEAEAIIVDIDMKAAATPNTLPLPKYFKACKVGPDFDECAVKSGQSAISTIVKGDGRYKIPVMEPLTIKKIAMHNVGSKASSLNVTLKNVKIVGLTNLKFISSKLNYKKKKLDWDFYVDRFSILSDYDINGRFLVLPIKGKGPANNTMTKVHFSYHIEWKNKKKNNVELINITKAKLKYDAARIYYSYKNLFNGDKTLSAAMNDFLNENWRDFNNAIGPSLADGMGKAFKSVLDSITKLVPERLIFPH